MDENKIMTEEELEQVNGGAGNKKVIDYTVQHGDNLTRIASYYRTTVNAIMRLNPNKIKDKNFIVTGWTIKVYDNR